MLLWMVNAWSAIAAPSSHGRTRGGSAAAAPSTLNPAKAVYVFTRPTLGRSPSSGLASRKPTQPWRASSRVCAASISSVTAKTLANAVCDPVQDTRAGSPVRRVVLHEARPGAAAGTTNRARLSTAGPRAGRTRIETDARNRFGVPYTSATARKLGVRHAEPVSRVGFDSRAA